jgi:autotransporter-associated beta strand protein
LLFGGSGNTAYTSNNNNTSMQLGTITLNSTAGVQETISGNAFDQQINVEIDQNNSGSFDVSIGSIFKKQTLTLGGSGSGLVTLSGVISGNSTSNDLAIVKNGTSTFILSNASDTNWGAVTVNVGLLRIATNGGTSSAFTISSGAMLGLDGNVDLSGRVLDASAGVVALNANNSLLSSVNGSGSHVSSAFIGSLGNFTLSSSTLAAGAGSNYRLGGGGGVLTVSGSNVITGANNLIVGSSQTNGSGVVLLTGNQNYTGTTTVASGSKLRVNSTLSGSSPGLITVNGTLGGTGTINRSITVASGGAITANDSGTVGELTESAGTQTWAGGGTYVWDISSATGSNGVDWDHIEMQSLNITATSGSKFTIKLQGSPTLTTSPTQKYTWTIAHAGSLTTPFDALAFNLDTTGLTTKGANGSFFISQSGGDIQISYIPEPGSMMMIGALATGLLSRRNRRR